MRAPLLLAAFACTCEDRPEGAVAGKESRRRGAESRADDRYPAPPALPDAPIELSVRSTDDDGTWSASGFDPGGPDGTNRAVPGESIVLRFDPGAALTAPLAARLHLPVVARGGEGPLVLRIQGLVDDGTPFATRSPGDRSRTDAIVTWTVPEPWPDPYTGMPDVEGRTALVCAPFERQTPDLAPIVAELLASGAGPLTFVVEAARGELVVQDTQDVGGTECPGRLAPRLELFPTLRSTFVAKELVGRPLDGTATVAMSAVVEVELSVEYGSTAEDRRSTPVVGYPAGAPIAVVLEGLAPSTAYTWTARYRRPGELDFETGPTQRLHTARAPGEPFTFTVTADSHFTNMEHRRALSSMHLWQQTLTRAGADAPDFHLDLGDSFNAESYRSYDAPDPEEALRRHLSVRPYFERIGAPLFSVLGNHEGEQGWRADGLPERAAEARSALFPNPTSPSPAEDWYSFRWGDVLVVVLDPYRYTMRKPHDLDGSRGSGDRWDWTLGKEQYDWLVRTLEESDATFELVFSHQVTGGTNEYGRGGRLAALGTKKHGSYEWGGLDPKGVPAFDEHRPGWGRPVHQVLAESGVTAFVHGHDHVFAWETPLDGVGYVTVPQPGDARYEVGHAPRSGLDPDATMLPNSGYVRFTAAPGALRLEYVRSYLPGDGPDGEVAFGYTFTDCDRNGVTDLQDVADGRPDANADGRPDDCR
jgi:hypothetical protein